MITKKEHCTVRFLYTEIVFQVMTNLALESNLFLFEICFDTLGSHLLEFVPDSSGFHVLFYTVIWRWHSKGLHILVFALIVLELWVTQRLPERGSVLFNKCMLLVYRKKLNITHMGQVEPLVKPSFPFLGMQKKIA